MWREGKDSLVPVLHDPIQNLTLYHLVNGPELSIALQTWMPKERNLTVDQEDRELRFKQRGAITGNILGALAFLGGIALLLLTFRLAYDMFTVNPSVLFGMNSKAPLDLGKAATILMGVGVRIALLIVMGIMGGQITNRGIQMYVDSRQTPRSVIVRERDPEPSKRSERRESEEERKAREVG